MTIHDDNLALAHRYAAAGMPVFPVNENRNRWWSIGKKMQRPILKK